MLLVPIFCNKVTAHVRCVGVHMRKKHHPDTVYMKCKVQSSISDLSIQATGVLVLIQIIIVFFQKMCVFIHCLKALPLLLAA